MDLELAKKMQELKEKKTAWLADESGDDAGVVFVALVDGVHCKMQEPR